MTSEELRLLRMTKVAKDATALMQRFVDEIESSEEFADVVGAWSQVLGAFMAQGHAISKESFDDLMEFVTGHTKVAYDNNIGKNHEKD